MGVLGSFFFGVMRAHTRAPRASCAAAIQAARPYGFGGSCASATPIIASLVTNALSSSSSQPSVPAGRRGITRYRQSAVESCTRSCVCQHRGQLYPAVQRARTGRGDSMPEQAAVEV